MCQSDGGPSGTGRGRAFRWFLHSANGGSTAHYSSCILLDARSSSAFSGLVSLEVFQAGCPGSLKRTHSEGQGKRIETRSKLAVQEATMFGAAKNHAASPPPSPHSRETVK